MNIEFTEKSNDIGLAVKTHSRKHYINVPKGKGFNYLSDVLTKLPSNVILNKKVAGIGGTYLEMNSKRNSIIAVPFVPIINGKLESVRKAKELGEDYIDIIPVFEGVSVQDLTAMILSAKGYIKIMSTYDGIPKVITAIGNALMDCKDFFLLVDEYHLLVTQYLLRHTAMRGVLSSFALFESVCFLSATQIPKKYLPKQMLRITQINMNWGDIKPANIAVVPTNDINYAVQNQVQNALDRDFSIYVFFSNVKGIVKTIESDPRLNNDTVRVICSDGDEEANLRLLEKIGIEKGTVKSDAKQINLVTSCAFEGVDFFGTDAKVYIAVSSRNTALSLDVNTTIRQLDGRIRDLRPNADINILAEIGKSKRFDAKTIRAELSKRVKIFKKDIKVYNRDYKKAAPATQKNMIFDPKITDFAYDIENGLVTYDDGSFSSALYSEMVKTEQYRSMDVFMNALLEAGFNARPELGIFSSDKKEQGEPWMDQILHYYSLRDEIVAIHAKYDKDFTALSEMTDKVAKVAEYSRIIDCIEAETASINDKLVIIEAKQRSFKSVYKHMSIEEVAEKEYKKDSVLSSVVMKKAVEKRVEKDISLTADVLASFKTGKLYTSDDIKKRFNEIFASLGIDKRATNKTVSEWFATEKRKVHNPKTLKKDSFTILVQPKQDPRLDIVSPIAGEFGYSKAKLERGTDAEIMNFLLDAHSYLNESEIASLHGNIEAAKAVISVNRKKSITGELEYKIFESQLLSKISTYSATRQSTVLNTINKIALGVGVDVDAPSVLNKYYNIETIPFPIGEGKTKTGKNKVLDIQLKLKSIDYDNN